MKRIGYVFKRLFHMSFKGFFETINKIHQRSGKSKIALFFDMIYCSIKFQAGYTDYFLFYFEELNNKQRSTYITRGVNNGYLKELNDSSYYHFLRNKIEFNHKFNQYLNREFIDLGTSTIDEFKAFVGRHPIFMAKPVALSGGFGVEKYEIKAKDNLDKIYHNIMDKKQFLLEEFIIQDKEMNRLCPASVNTLRIVTVRKNNKTTIMLRAIRIGNGINHVDNFHSGGMYSLFDENGVITKPAMDREGKLFVTHPTTGVKIEGFHIPYYQEALDLVMKLSTVIPEIGLVGWDIAISNKGPVLVEGNELPGYDIYQSKIHLNSKREGLKPVFDKVIYGESCKK